jgi:hypothetical protein
MDITSLLFIGFMMLIGIIIFSILPVLSFLLYKFLKKKSKCHKNIGLTIFILTTLGMIAIGIKIILNPGFGPEYDTATIEQKIGGKLLCNSVYNADIHSWQYDVDYKYVDSSGDTIVFGSGAYCGREWKKDEQLSRFEEFLILKTGSWHDSDRLIIKNIQNDSTKIYDINSQFIEQDSFWKAQNIKSLLDYCCPEAFITSIDGNQISLKYKFRINENLVNLYGERILIYQMNKNGDIKMIKCSAPLRN